MTRCSYFNVLGAVWSFRLSIKLEESIVCAKAAAAATENSLFPILLRRRVEDYSCPLDESFTRDKYHR